MESLENLNNAMKLSNSSNQFKSTQIQKTARILINGLFHTYKTLFGPKNDL